MAKRKKPKHIPLYEIYAGEELRIAELILRRRLQMLVHSCLYYEMDKSILSDWQWGEWAQELAQLQQEYPEISGKVWWADEFSDWDGSSGQFLPLRDRWVSDTANYVLMLHEKYKEENK